MTKIRTVYRARRWFDSSAATQIADTFFNIANTDPSGLIASAVASQDGWKIWFEPCPVIKTQKNYIFVQSEDIEGSPFYAGGTFRLSIADLRNHGKVYHSRHGEWFHLKPHTISEPWFPASSKLAAQQIASA